MSRIVRSTDVRGALKTRQRGFLLNPFRFGGGGGGGGGGVAVSLDFEGANGSTTFTDTSGKVWTANGSAQISTAQAYAGTSSGYFEGSSGSSYISTPAHANFNFSNRPFVIQGWFYPTSMPGSRGLFSRRISAVYGQLELQYGGAGTITALIANPTLTTWAYVHGFSGVALTANTWNKVRLESTGTLMTLYVNDVACSNPLNHTPLADTTAPFYIGRGGDGAYFGYIDNFTIQV
jgi:hypothetical protein